MPVAQYPGDFERGMWEHTRRGFEPDEDTAAYCAQEDREFCALLVIAVPRINILRGLRDVKLSGDQLSEEELAKAYGTIAAVRADLVGIDGLSPSGNKERTGYLRRLDNFEKFFGS